MIVVGAKPRPRIALLGDWSDEDVELVGARFPTVVRVQAAEALTQTGPHPAELDLLCIGENAGHFQAFVNSANIVNFQASGMVQFHPSFAVLQVARRVGDELIRMPVPDEFEVLQRHLEAGCAEGLHRLTVVAAPKVHSPSQTASVAAKLTEHCIFSTLRPTGALGVILYPEVERTFSWLPGFDRRAEWVAAVCGAMSRRLPDQFPPASPWERDPEWASPPELQAIEALRALEGERRATIAALDERHSQLQLAYDEAHVNAARGVKRLLTEQGESLVAAVADALRLAGFDVVDMDGALTPDQAKREDLRIRLTSPEGEWVALVEVRGYSKSGGKTADLTRLERFARLYSVESGHAPSKLIYIVNHFMGTPPPSRRMPMGGAEEDVREFQQAPGLILSTTFLYRAMIRDPQIVRELLHSQVGLLDASSRE